MQIHVGNLRRKGDATLVDAQPRGAPNMFPVIAVALRFVGRSIQPAIANGNAEKLPPELVADIFASVREFVGANEERISDLLLQHD